MASHAIKECMCLTNIFSKPAVKIPEVEEAA